MDVSRWTQTLVDVVTHAGFQILGAIALWIVGRWLIRVCTKLVGKALERQHVDHTLATYAIATVTGLLNVVLIVSILGAFGIQTASFAAILAALGFAIGTAWGGLLSNFAAGIFMVVLRPFKVGDFVTAADITGTVVEIGPFTTKINTMDNVLVIVGNNKILGDNIRNFTHNPYRRVDLVMQLNHDAMVPSVSAALKERLCQIPNVLSDPAPDVEILEFTLSGPKLAVRPYCANANYWQVYFDTNRIIREVGASKLLAAPAQHVVVRSFEASPDGAAAIVTGEAVVK